MVEGIGFTVYGTNDLADATAAAGTANVFNGGDIESGAVPVAGPGSTFSLPADIALLGVEVAAVELGELLRRHASHPQEERDLGVRQCSVVCELVER